MRLPAQGASVRADATAKGHKEIVFTKRVTVSIGPARMRATRVGVWARGNRCQGSPWVLVRVDRRRVLHVPVRSGGWREYSAPVRIRSGRHVLRLSFPNPFRSRRCQRRLNVSSVLVSNGREASPASWQLVFDDEFNGTQLDTTRWNPFNWTARSNFYNPANALVEGGLLRLRAASPKSSAMVQTLGKLSMLYGRIEASIRVPRGQGFWPAFWLRPANPALRSPEIDILEMWFTDIPNDLYDQHTVSENYHWVDSAGTQQADHSWVRGSTDYSGGFHRFALEWDPHSIRWYIDGIETKEITGSIVAHTPMSIILSLQIGHAWWLGADGDPDANTPFPSYMDVNWVHVYRLRR